jgi:hypothetical protein
MVPPEIENDLLSPAMVPVPPQLLVSTDDAATLICPGLVGRISEKAVPVMARLFGLLRVIVRSEVPPVAIWVGAKVLTAVGAASSVVTKEALAAEPLPALVVVMIPVELLYEPTMALVTFTDTVQLPLAGTVAPDSATDGPLLTAVTVPPIQVVAPLARAVFTKLAG